MGILLALAMLQVDLVRDLGNDSIQVREGAARRLRAIGEEAIPDLQAADHHPDAEIRSRALMLIRRIEAEACFDPGLLNRHPELLTAVHERDHDRILNMASRCGKENFEVFALGCLADPDVNARKTGLLILERLQGRDSRFARPANGRLIPLIETWNPEQWKDGDRKYLQMVVQLVLNHVSDHDRPQLAKAKAEHVEAQQALRILQAAAGLPEGTETLVELLGRGTPWLRLPALQAAQKGRCTAARQAVIALLCNPNLGDAAAKTLLVIGDECCRPAIAQALNALTERQRPSLSKHLLEEWVPRPSVERPHPPQFFQVPEVEDPTRLRIEAPPEALRKMLNDWDAGRADREARRKLEHPWCATGATGEREAGGADILHALAAGGDRSLSSLFVDRLASPDPECQQEAIRVCGEWRLQEAAPVLRRLVRVGSPEVRARALKSLALLESK